MKALWVVTGIILLGGVAFAMSETTKSKEYSWRYKMTVEIETPDGLKTGSAVRQVEIVKKLIAAETVIDPKTKIPKEKKHYKYDRKVTGEAVIIDLGNDNIMFALIDDTAYQDVINAFNTPKYEDAVALPLGSKAELKASVYPEHPRIVTFTDMNDPKTVTLVYSQKTYADRNRVEIDHFEEFFGAGISLKQITIEITDEPISWGIVDKYLPSSFEDEITKKWRDLPRQERGRLVNLIAFKRGEPK